MNIPFDKKLHARMVAAALRERQSIRQLVMRLVDEGLRRLELAEKAEAARG